MDVPVGHFFYRSMLVMQSFKKNYERATQAWSLSAGLQQDQIEPHFLREKKYKCGGKYTLLYEPHFLREKEYKCGQNTDTGSEFGRD